MVSEEAISSELALSNIVSSNVSSAFEPVIKQATELNSRVDTSLFNRPGKTFLAVFPFLIFFVVDILVVFELHIRFHAIELTTRASYLL